MAVCTFTASVEEKQERRWCLELTDLLVLLNCYVPDSVRHPVLENKAGRSIRNHLVLASYLHMHTHMHMYTHMLIHTKRKSMKRLQIYFAKICCHFESGSWCYNNTQSIINSTEGRESRHRTQRSGRERHNLRTSCFPITVLSHLLKLHNIREKSPSWKSFSMQ